MNLPAITGLGLITPLGGNSDETFDALIAGRFIENEARAKFANGKGGNVNDLAIAAAREATAQAGWNKWPEDTAIVAGTSKGDIESWLAAMDEQQRAVRKESRAVPGPELSAMFPWEDRFGLGDLAAVLARDLHADSCIRLTYSAACASGLHALSRAVMLIQSGEARAALVVAAESSLHPIFQGCFSRLGVLAPPSQPCRPFDLNRHGFHISQAAAAICIERMPIGGSRTPLALIDHAALAGDAWHLTGTDPDGRTLRRLLRAAICKQPPDLIHAHGTGTVSNDVIELAALESVLPDATPLPILYSHKAAIGHSLGASGLVSVVINCLIHQRRLVMGNICTKVPLRMGKLVLHSEAITWPVRRSLVLASGFGGTVSVVGLRSP